MSPGLQAAQACHTLRQFVGDHPDIDRRWNQESQFLIILSVPNELELRRLAQRAVDEDLRIAVWREPDMENSVTGIAIEPSARTERLCAQLPLALKEIEGDWCDDCGEPYHKCACSIKRVARVRVA